ncbi:hypothetical protein B0H14DRAFT_3150619 [Mycena olivaceomarginata]|nr:hypothetical protein B0H14DRAFT_3150619 [Mycena olivaceomarginata]
MYLVNQPIIFWSTVLSQIADQPTALSSSLVCKIRSGSDPNKKGRSCIGFSGSRICYKFRPPKTLQAYTGLYRPIPTYLPKRTFATGIDGNRGMIGGIDRGISPNKSSKAIKVPSTAS